MTMDYIVHEIKGEQFCHFSKTIRVSNKLKENGAINCIFSHVSVKGQICPDRHKKCHDKTIALNNTCISQHIDAFKLKIFFFNK